jgi:transcriptional regulator with XRE-family HTH domain
LKIGNTIKLLREREGLLQKDFAKKIGISPSYLSQIESDKIVPRYKKIIKICKCLNLEEDTFFYLSIDLSIIRNKLFI